MQSYSRRSTLAAAAAGGIGLLSGCSLPEKSPPAGSLVVQNRHSLPHLVEIEFLDAPEKAFTLNEAPKETVSVEPNDEKTYEEILSTHGEYKIRAKCENNDPVQFSVRPFSPPNGEIPSIRIEGSGNLTWVVAARRDGLF